jgi:rhodanese-related sulfurtransferase
MGAVVLVLLIFEELKGKISNVKKLSAQETSLLLSRENATIIDLRNQKAFANGHILGAKNIAYNDIDHHLKKLEAHKNNPLILVDDNDTNTASASTKLYKQGFTKIYTLAGGLNSWKEAQSPLIRD